jgi:hypothetical protein
VARECDPEVLDGLDLTPWCPGDMDHVIRIVPTSITGRRLELNLGSSADARGYM